MKRFTDGRAYQGNVGMPAVVEHPEGEYMLVSDHLKLLAACESHNELLLARLKRAEGKKCKSEN